MSPLPEIKGTTDMFSELYRLYTAVRSVNRQYRYS